MAKIRSLSREAITIQDSTGELQQAIAQPLQDEINHLAKFWGFSRWAFADTFSARIKGTTRN